MKIEKSMKTENCKLKIIFMFVLPLLILFLSSEVGNASAQTAFTEKTIVKPNVIVSATIGIPKMTLWGYGSPNSVVELTGVNVDQTTSSDGTGYYSFDLVYLPDTETFPELCITAIDNGKRVTMPTCIPPINRDNYFYSVGPVILPPTISLGAPQTYPESQVSAQGTTIPNSIIEIKLARPNIKQGSLSFKIVRTALAYYVPSYTVVSDAEGKYSFNVPTNKNITWRLFAITDYKDGNKSPKSNTLVFETLTEVSYIKEKVVSFLVSLLGWPNILVLEAFLIIILAIIVWLISRKKKTFSGKKKAFKSDQKYSQIVKKYQEYLKIKTAGKP